MRGDWALLGVCVVIALVALWRVRQAGRESRACPACGGRGFTWAEPYGEPMACGACPAGQAYEAGHSDTADWPV